MIEVTALPEYLVNLLQNKTKVFIGDLPSLSDEGVGVALENGTTNSTYFGMHSCYNPYIRFTVRTKKYIDGMARAEQIKQDLNMYHDDSILKCTIIGSPMYIGKNQQSLHEIQILFQVSVH